MKYSIEIDCEKRRTKDNKVCEYLVAYGDNLQELIDSATIGYTSTSEFTKYYPADEPWMIALIYEKYIVLEAGIQEEIHVRNRETLFEDSMTVFFVGTIIVGIGIYSLMAFLLPGA